EACTGNQCMAVANPSCKECGSAADCLDNDPCTQEKCLVMACVIQTTPGCCAGNVQCDDGDPCTVNRCIDNKCVFTPIPNC
ncbi:MAG: hypothetical protein FJ087_21240, partial [Deltaproteobacteria bacterium]|nr:hypothetical protein [Deltaproteobacteria bacterium]